jgi:uncharacterized membrane protein YphA (DoxX/SURF4 family)
MQVIVTIVQLVIALGILNVWILRFGKSTAWRGGGAKSMKEEFSVYGLPSWSVGLIGFLKILFAALLIIGVWVSAVVKPAAFGLAILMLGAILMHIKVKDSPQKSVPAVTVLVMCLLVLVLHRA